MAAPPTEENRARLPPAWSLGMCLALPCLVIFMREVVNHWSSVTAENRDELPSAWSLGMFLASSCLVIFMRERSGQPLVFIGSGKQGWIALSVVFGNVFGLTLSGYSIEKYVVNHWSPVLFVTRLS